MAASVLGLLVLNRCFLFIVYRTFDQLHHVRVCGLSNVRPVDLLNNNRSSSVKMQYVVPAVFSHMRFITFNIMSSACNPALAAAPPAFVLST